SLRAWPATGAAPVRVEGRACVAAARPRPTPDEHRADVRGIGPPAPGSTAPRARAPCGSARRAPPSTFGTCPTVRCANTLLVDPSSSTPGGAKTDEHYRPRWGQIR